MILPIYNLAYDVQDFERVGNFLNYKFGLAECPDLYLFPFKCPNIPHSSNTIVDFQLRRISINAEIKTIEETTILDTNLIQINIGTDYDYYYFQALSEIANDLSSGVYEFYIKDNGDNEFISELFFLCSGGNYPQPIIQTLITEEEEQILTENNNILIEE